MNSRNYDNNVNCDWILKSDPLTRIVVTIRYVNMESSRSCRYDSLNIYDGLYGSRQNWNRTDRVCRRSQRYKTYKSSGKFNFEITHNFLIFQSTALKRLLFLLCENFKRRSG